MEPVFRLGLPAVIMVVGAGGVGGVYQHYCCPDIVALFTPQRPLGRAVGRSARCYFESRGYQMGPGAYMPLCWKRRVPVPGDIINIFY